MKLINTKLLEDVVSQAKLSLRKRKNYNFHDSLDDTLQRMLNAIEPGSYVQPHKHENPDKTEAFLILKGKAMVVEFDENGEITTHTIVSPADGVYGCEIAPATWHTIVSLEPGTVVYEVKDGPYSALNDKNFAAWAPKEGDPECGAFLQQLIQRCGFVK
jgi:cupin fold WbuC family metalloprotein